MRILVLSDSHGNLSNMERAVDLTRPDRIFHLGDCWRDAERLHECFPELPLEQVPGNCDFRPAELPERLLILEGKRLLLCHGHTYGVKESLAAAARAAQAQNIDLFLFGHTHRPFRDLRGNSLLVNPGSIGDYSQPSYALVRLEDGGLEAEVLRLG